MSAETRPHRYAVSYIRWSNGVGSTAQMRWQVLEAYTAADAIVQFEREWKGPALLVRPANFEIGDWDGDLFDEEDA